MRITISATHTEVASVEGSLRPLVEAPEFCDPFNGLLFDLGVVWVESTLPRPGRERVRERDVSSSVRVHCRITEMLTMFAAISKLLYSDLAFSFRFHSVLFAMAV